VLGVSILVSEGLSRFKWCSLSSANTASDSKCLDMVMIECLKESNFEYCKEPILML
jgi:hypothetical protein